MLQFLIIAAAIAMLIIFLPRLAVCFIATIFAGGVCICAWMLGPLLGLPTYRSMGEAPWYFGSMFLIFLVLGFVGISGIFRESGRIE